MHRVRRHRQVLIKKLRRETVVGMYPANFRCGEYNDFGPMLGEEAIHAGLRRQVKFVTVFQQQVLKSAGSQLTNHRTSHHASVASNVD